MIGQDKSNGSPATISTIRRHCLARVMRPAIVSGSRRKRREGDSLERQARLEPGRWRFDDQGEESCQ
jgi:hypothetical protein